MYPTRSMSGPNKNTEIDKLKTFDEFWSPCFMKGL